MSAVVAHEDINYSASRAPNRGIFRSKKISNPEPERRLEGIVSAEMETWLNNIWNEFDINSDSKDPALVKAFEERKKYRVEKNIEVIKELHELMENITGDPSAELQSFIQNFGIANFARYSADRLFDQHLQWKANNFESTNILVLAARHGDYSGSFDNVTLPFEQQDISNVFVFELPPSATAIQETVDKMLSKGAKLRTTVLSGHGDLYTGIPDLGIDATASGLENLSNSLRGMSPKSRPVIILDSCLTGDDNGVGYSLAKKISSAVSNVEVVAPNKVIYATNFVDGAWSFDNRAPSTGRHVLHSLEWKTDEATGELEPIFSETQTRLRGSAVRAHAAAFVNGEELHSPSISHRPSRVVSSMNSPKPTTPPLQL